MPSEVVTVGERGPVPKRSNQRLGHRSKAEKADVTHVAVDDEVRGPDLPAEHSETAVRFWEALRRSGQARFFQPSDWAAAELAVLAIDSFVQRPSAVMLASINSIMSNLLTTEGDRRRVRVELERTGEGGDADGDVVSELAEYRERAAKSS
jgi:hypothetical protein